MKWTVNRYIIALLSGIVVCMLVVPAIADYSGDQPLTTYEHGMVNGGGLVYEAVTDGTGYTRLNAINPANYTQEITISIPEGKTVKTARLYNYYTFSSSGPYNASVPGDPAEANLTFGGVLVTCQNPAPVTNTIDYGNGVIQYWDSKGQGYDPAIVGSYAKKYDFPSGTFAWDVTDLVTGSGTYMATIENADSSPEAGEYFRTFGFGLLVVYENADPDAEPDTEYWIAEGCDYLYTKKYETPESATTSAMFDKEMDGMKKATLTTVLTASDKGTLDPPLNMVYFNGKEIGPSTALGKEHIGVNEFDVKLKSSNIAEFQDIDDCEVVCNAFLVTE